MNVEFERKAGRFNQSQKASKKGHHDEGGERAYFLLSILESECAKKSSFSERNCSPILRISERTGVRERERERERERL